MAERDPDGIFSKMPHVDLVCGPGELNKVPALIAEVQDGRSRAVALAQSLSRKSTPLQRAIEYDSVEALDLSIAMPSVIASQMSRQHQSVPGPDSQIVAGAWDQPFAIPNQRVTGYRAPELAPISSWRSARRPSME